MLSIKFKNLDSFMDKWTQAKDVLQSSAVEGLEVACWAIMRKSKEECPHDTGTLQRTGNVDIDKEKRVGYLSYNTPYAVKMHEHPEYNFQKGRKAKYLEDPIKQGVSTVLTLIGERIKNVL